MSAAFGSPTEADRDKRIAALTSAKRSALRAVLSMARGGDITARQVRDALDVNERSAQRYLADLVNHRLLHRKRPVVMGVTVTYSITEDGRDGL
jgi:DNA-binding HxlR family transcriptional regulator